MNLEDNPAGGQRVMAPREAIQMDVFGRIDQRLERQPGKLLCAFLDRRNSHGGDGPAFPAR